MKWKKLEMPKSLEFEKDTFSDIYGKFFAEPFERGYATTIGNSLRRILLSSIQGAAITSIKANGAQHEFATIPGVVEDMQEIILNLKEVRLKLNTNNEPKKIYLKAEGERIVKAKDITPDAEVEIANPDKHIATLTTKTAKLEIEMDVETGRGYVSAEKNKKEGQVIGIIPIDSIFTPVVKVRFEVENARVGQITDYDRLIMEIWTDGRIKPDDALAHAAFILKDHMNIFINFEEEPEAIEEEKVDEEKEKLREMLTKSVDELELSVRASNCLKVANIKSIIELVEKTEQDMLKYRNFGRKSLSEIKDILTSMGLGFGMQIDPELLKPKPKASKKKEK
jgi:DNA-directed RNA polymerase subunit alpha